ncbi:YcxB family protein [Lactococcus nasutitermitis]|uniref:YcxB family protein n=1 Tax=Lactococcus nasutitermitis TaxID=1652957 RepID=A0ABV9JCK4_9LACT|nr:YcxB family protein [Lactococcus nasutitermitis]
MVSQTVKKFEKNNPAVATSQQNLQFTDEQVTIESTGDLQNGTSEMKYESFTSVRETADSFYLYISNSAAFLLTKSDFTQGTPDELRQLLQEKIKRYK